MMGKKDKANGKAKRPFHKGGMPPFVPSELDRAVVELLVSMGMPQRGVCRLICGRNGKPIAETTLKKYFAHELKVGKAAVVLKVLAKFMQAIEKGERWAIERYMDQRMWHEEWGGWRARPYEVAISGVLPEGSGRSEVVPLQLIVQFVKPDPSMRPTYHDEGSKGRHDVWDVTVSAGEMAFVVSTPPDAEDHRQWPGRPSCRGQSSTSPCLDSQKISACNRPARWQSCPNAA